MPAARLKATIDRVMALVSLRDHTLFVRYQWKQAHRHRMMVRLLSSMLPAGGTAAGDRIENLKSVTVNIVSDGRNRTLQYSTLRDLRLSRLRPENRRTPP
jgi:hypothetical protein